MRTFSDIVATVLIVVAGMSAILELDRLRNGKRRFWHLIPTPLGGQFRVSMIYTAVGIIILLSTQWRSTAGRCAVIGIVAALVIAEMRLRRGARNAAGR